VSLFSTADLATFKTDRLLASMQSYFPDVTLSDAYLLQQIQASEADIRRRLKVYLEPTTLFPYAPSDAEIAALAGAPYDEEPGYDYDPAFFSPDSWGYIVLRHRPAISVEFIRFAYTDPSAPLYTIPGDWIRLDKKYGQIRIVPTAQMVTLPLSVFLMQAMGGGRTIPSMIQVKYISGIKNAKTDPQWADLIDVILKQAVLNIIEGGYLPQSGSISADGLSQSVSFDAQKFRDTIDAKLFGPKGSNGGLWSSIHGIVGTMAGGLA
jgi:hypothetical protein